MSNEAIETAQSMQQVHGAGTATGEAVLHWYDIPPKIAAKTGVTKIGLVELGTGDELMATRRANGDPIRLAFELAKETIRFVNETPVNTGEGTADAFWGSKKEGMPRLRQLIMRAYSEIHNPDEDEVASFLDSHRMLAGDG